MSNHNFLDDIIEGVGAGFLMASAFKFILDVTNVTSDDHKEKLPTPEQVERECMKLELEMLRNQVNELKNQKA